LLAKLIVWGSDRANALARARRALAEFEVDGLPTVLPFHRAVTADPAFVAPDGVFSVHTQWIEHDFDNQIEPHSSAAAAGPVAPVETMVVEVNRRRIEVVLPAGIGLSAPVGNGAVNGAHRAPRRSAKAGAAHAAGGNAVTSPMQGTVVRIAVDNGDQIAEGDLIMVIEAMKMEQPLNAPKAGTVNGLAAEVGATVSGGQLLCTIDD
jgi:acetyl-CoA/propionyl-CoA carboxylase biotin carboxyl carrier protein